MTKEYVSKIEFLFIPFIFGMITGLCPIIGLMTAMMLGYKIKTQLFWTGMFGVSFLFLFGNIIVTLFLPMVNISTITIYAIGIILLFLGGGKLKEQ